jgi:hypothetical protein
MMISQVQIGAQSTPDKKSPRAKQLQAFFTACAAALTPLVRAVTLSVVTRKLSTSDNTTVEIALSGEAKGGVKSAFAFGGAPARTVKSIAIVGNVLKVTASGALTAGTHTIAYTQPAAADRVRDSEGNELASFTAAAIA